MDKELIVQLLQDHKAYLEKCLRRAKYTHDQEILSEKIKNCDQQIAELQSKYRNIYTIRQMKNLCHDETGFIPTNVRVGRFAKQKGFKKVVSCDGGVKQLIYVKADAYERVKSHCAKRYITQEARKQLEG